MEVSESYNVDIHGNDHELKETKRISVKIQRIQNDGPTSEDGKIVSLRHVEKIYFYCIAISLYC